MKLSERLSGKDIKKERNPESSSPADIHSIINSLHNEVIDHLDMAALPQTSPERVGEIVKDLVQKLLLKRNIFCTEVQLERIVRYIVDEITGFGPLESLLNDPTVSDILINSATKIFIERKGILEQTAVQFRDDAHLINTINRIVGRVGRRIDTSSPMVDARLPDGSRVNAIIPPLAIDGPVMSIRRFATGPTTIAQLISNAALTESMAHYLRCAVHAKCNILVAGGTGAGKTTLLNALSSFIPSHERIITIEDSAELRLQQKHVVRLETRPPNIEGKGEVAIRDLVRNSLRMRPDRIIVGEVRSEEVLDMIQAMNTGHEGSLTTVHANNAMEAITRLMTMMSMAGTKLTEKMMMQMIGRAIHLIVFIRRQADGYRRIHNVAEVYVDEHEEIQLHEVFKYEVLGVGSRGKVEGRFVCSGQSIWVDRFAEAGVSLK